MSGCGPAMAAGVASATLLFSGCLKNNPDFIDGSSSTGSGTTTSTTYNDGSSTTAATCEAELTQEPAPHELGAFDLGATGRADGALDVGIGDAWFALTIPMGDAGLVRLRAGVATSSTDEFQVCAFFDCDDATPAFVFDCQGGNDRDATSAGDRPGCCGDDSQVVPVFSCSGQFAEARIQVLSALPLRACVPFELAFELDEY